MVASSAQAAEDLFVYVTPSPIGVNDFLRLGKVGAEAAATQFGAEFAMYESTSAESRAENVAAAVNEGASVVIVPGFEFSDVISQIAPTAPDTQFLIIDSCIDNQPDNVHCAVFREYEASYLAGVAAAMISTSGHIGVLGALDIPFLHRYTDGYAQGAKSVNDQIVVDVRWVGGESPFSDPVRAKEQAIALNGAGSDVIFAAAAGGNFGVFEAANEKNFLVLGVDTNLCPAVAGRMIDATLKRVDNAVTQAMAAVMNGDKKVFMTLGLKEAGVALVAQDDAGLAASGCLVADKPEVVAKVRDVAAQIIDGTLMLEDPMFAK